MHRLPEYGVNHLRNYGPRLPDKIPPRSVTVLAVRPKIRYLLGDNLTLSLAWLLIFIAVVFINLVHELAFTGNRFPVNDLIHARRVSQP